MRESQGTVEDVLDLEPASVSASLAKAELNQQITTAKAFPRSVAKFMKDTESLVTLNETVG